jgi:hypothetical protein
MQCPNCKKEVTIIVNDGGSRVCTDCDITFHKCLGGETRYGFPGPCSCPFCKSIVCPKCNNETSPRFTTEDESIICRHYKITFHICLGNISKIGFSGSCVFCPLKEIS